MSSLSSNPLVYICSISCYSLFLCVVCMLFTFLIMKSIIGSADTSVGTITKGVVDLAGSKAVEQLTSADVVKALTAIAPTGAAAKSVGEVSDALGLILGALPKK